MTNIKAKLEILFEFIKKLNQLLDEEKYASFFTQQQFFDDQLKDCLNSYPEEKLVEVLEELKVLRKMVSTLKIRADTETLQLKEKSLSLQRNKKKISAYK